MGNWKRRMLMKAVVGCQLFAVLALQFCAACSDAESEKILRALELEDVAAYWAIQGQDEEKNNYIHPVVRFRVFNGAEQDLDYVQVMAVFKREKLPDEPWGNAFAYSISEEPIPPGATSDAITLRSDTSFISKDSPRQMFLNEKWEEVQVEIFLRVGPSSWQILESRPVPKHIGAPGLEKFLEPAEDTETSFPQ